MSVGIKKLIKMICFFVFFILTGIMFFYIPEFRESYFKLNIASRIVEDLLFLTPLWIANIIGGLVIGKILKIITFQTKVKSIVFILLGCMISQCSFILVLAIHFTKTMSYF